jgi:hypothetical protein
MHAVTDVITPRQVAAIVEEKYNIPISFGPNGGVSYATFLKFLDTNGNAMEEMWHNMKFFYDHSTCRGDPRDARKLIASQGMTLTSLEEILKELHSAGALNL